MPFVGIFVTSGPTVWSDGNVGMGWGGYLGAIRAWRWANAGASCEDACRLRVAIARRVAFTIGAERCDVVSTRRIGERAIGG